MQEVTGDIWNIDRSCCVIIPTNVGYRADGRNVMGKGLARAAALRFPWLADAYGNDCMLHVRAYGAAEMKLKLYSTSGSKWCHSLLMAPVKNVMLNKPYLSWNQPASLARVELSLHRIQQMAESMEGNRVLASTVGTHILVPLLGCGNGGLEAAVVIELARGILTSSKLILVLPSEDALQKQAAERDRPRWRRD